MTNQAPPGSRQPKSGDNRQLSRDDWLNAASSDVAAGGFGQLRVLTLAKKLGVSRGSFYWHFRDHDDLVVSFLERWRDRRLELVEHWNPEGGDVETELRGILDLLLADASRNMRRLQVELAVRDYARRNDYAAALVHEVDDARIRKNCTLFRRLSDNPERIRDLSMLFYVAIVGSQVVLTGSQGDEDAIKRIEDLMVRVVLGLPD